jgi:tRNA threonylcarbamoyl adenosine modification protein YeaZ
VLATLSSVLLLAFDTATPAVTVALHDGERVLAESTSVDGRRHGELLAPAIAAVLAQAGAAAEQVTDLAVGVGPGPFTGLRVGLVTALTWGSARGVPVHGVCTLDVLAYASGLGEPFAVATDARRREVYWARYDDHLTRSGPPMVARPADVAAQLGGLPVVGAGAALYAEDFPDHRRPELPAGGALADLAVLRLRSGGEGLLPAVPLYLRRPDAVVPSERKQVSGVGRERVVN